MENTEPKAGVFDGFENEIEVGDKIVYATRRGSSTYLNKMKVTKVDYHSKKVTGYLVTDPTRRSRVIQSMSTAHVVEKGTQQNVD